MLRYQDFQANIYFVYIINQITEKCLVIALKDYFRSHNKDLFMLVKLHYEIFEQTWFVRIIFYINYILNYRVFGIKILYLKMFHIIFQNIKHI